MLARGSQLEILFSFWMMFYITNFAYSENKSVYKDEFKVN